MTDDLVDVGPPFGLVPRAELVEALNHQRARQEAAWALRMASPCPRCGHPTGEHVERTGGPRKSDGREDAETRRECTHCDCDLRAR